VVESLPSGRAPGAAPDRAENYVLVPEPPQSRRLQ
jgi:hypothetical protein